MDGRFHPYYINIIIPRLGLLCYFLISRGIPISVLFHSIDNITVSEIKVQKIVLFICLQHLIYFLLHLITFDYIKDQMNFIYLEKKCLISIDYECEPVM